MRLDDDEKGTEIIRTLGGPHLKEWVKKVIRKVNGSIQNSKYVKNVTKNMVKFATYYNSLCLFTMKTAANLNGPKLGFLNNSDSYVFLPINSLQLFTIQGASRCKIQEIVKNGL